MTQLFLKMGPVVNAPSLTGQEERVDNSKVRHGISLQHGIIKNRSNCLLQLRNIVFCWQNLAHDDMGGDQAEIYDGIWGRKEIEYSMHLCGF